MFDIASNLHLTDPPSPSAEVTICIEAFIRQTATAMEFFDEKETFPLGYVQAAYHQHLAIRCLMENNFDYYSEHGTNDRIIQILNLTLCFYDMAYAKDMVDTCTLLQASPEYFGFTEDSSNQIFDLCERIITRGAKKKMRFAIAEILASAYLECRMQATQQEANHIFHKLDHGDGACAAALEELEPAQSLFLRLVIEYLS
ncbi:hypothetical protein ABW20_dc0105131 [Dactylellina cionopaga]|nr:hypothetical protein ABW20_dc0105131 [Dactylellina cionopaga]